MAERALLMTGASSAIGAAVLRRVGASYDVVFAHYKGRRETLDAFAREHPGVEVLPLQADFKVESDVDAMLEAVAARGVAPSALVHLAAPAYEFIRFKELSWARVQEEIDVSLRPAHRLLGAVLPGMARQGYGKVVVMLSSVVLGQPPRATAHYAAVKFALLGLVKALAVEFAEKHVCINAISPSLVETPFLEKIPAKLTEMTAQRSPWGRNATPEDIAPVIAFLLGRDSDYMTGANIPCTAGSFVP